jgi:hypothetical protein
MLSARGSAGGGVAGKIVFAEVGFRLDDDSAGDPFLGLAFEDGAEQIARYELGITRVKIARQYFAAAIL